MNSLTMLNHISMLMAAQAPPLRGLCNCSDADIVIALLVPTDSDRPTLHNEGCSANAQQSFFCWKSKKRIDTSVQLI